MHSTACGVGASTTNSTTASMQAADGLKMGLSNNDDAMNKMPLKSVIDDEEKNGGEFIHDTATAEEARREQRRVKLLNLMKKLTIGIICFIGIALISYVIISLCFSEWPKSTSTNPNKHHNNKNSNTTSTTTSTTTTPPTITTMTSTTTIINPSNYPPNASPILSLPSTFKSFLSDDNNAAASSSAASPSPTNTTLAASMLGIQNNDDIATLNYDETLPTDTVTATGVTDTLGPSTPSTPAFNPSTSLPSSTDIPLNKQIPNSASTLNKPLLRDIPITVENFTSTLGVFQHAAVCSDKHVCSQIGSTILQDGGSAVDAAIATLLCNGITTPQSMGIGGGMLMNIYIKNNKQAYFVDAREIAPFAATPDMFNDKQDLSLHGGLAIAVPGELMGYHRAYEKFGKLPWKKLVEPSVKLCKEGFYMSKHLKAAYTNKFDQIKSDALLSKQFINETTQTLHPVGTKIYSLPELCNTYELLAANGAQDFYNGTLAKLVAEDLKELGSTVTYDDLESYRADFGSSISMQLGEDMLYAVPPVSSGTVVANILSILEGFNFTQADLQDAEHQATTIHRFVEAMKFGYAKRWELGDMRFNDVRDLVSRLTNPETGIQLRKQINDTTVLDNTHAYGAQFSGKDDFGTSALVVMAPNGDAVAVTSSINDYFGSGQAGKRTGIIFNSGMNDFSTPGQSNLFNLPPSPSNFIDAQKRPMSSMSPMIVADQKSNVRMALSAAGGSQIISAIVDVMARVLWMNQNIKEAIDAQRFHSQLVPNELKYENSTYYSEELLKLLADKGHILKPMPFGSVVCGVVKNSTAVYTNADYRKRGGIAGF